MSLKMMMVWSNIFTRLDSQQFTDILAEAFICANQNAAENYLLQLHSTQPQQQPPVFVPRLRERNDVINNDLDAVDERSGSNVDDSDNNDDNNDSNRW